MTEEEIAGLFERVARDLDFPGIEAVVSAAEGNGGRRRHRQRAFLAAGSIVATGAVVIAIASTGVVPGLTGTLGLASSAAATSHAPKLENGHHVKQPSPNVQHGRQPATTPSPSPSPRMTGEQIFADLKAMLPSGSTISDARTTCYTADPGDCVEFNYNDGHGAVDFNFAIEPTSWYQNPLACSRFPDEGPRPVGALPQSCVMRRLSDGSLERDWVSAADVSSWYVYMVTDHRPDGTTVDLSVGNGTLLKLGPNGQLVSDWPVITRAVPPGSLAEWEAIVENPIWHL